LACICALALKTNDSAATVAEQKLILIGFQFQKARNLKKEMRAVHGTLVHHLRLRRKAPVERQKPPQRDEKALIEHAALFIQVFAWWREKQETPAVCAALTRPSFSQPEL
jgi:hypothetical protein